MVRKRTYILPQTDLSNWKQGAEDTGARNGPKGGALHEAVRFHYLSRRRSGVADRAGALIMAW